MGGRPPFSLAWALSWALLLAPIPARPDPPPAAADVDREVRRLGSSDPGEREGARRRLLGWGVDDPARILRALPEGHPDLEVSASCAELRVEIPFRRAERDAVKACGRSAALAEAVSTAFDKPSLESVLRLSVRIHRPVQGLAEPLCSLLPRLDAHGRNALIGALEKLQDPACALPVSALLEDENPTLRHAAMQALVALKAVGAEPTLRRILESSKDDHVRMMAMDAAAGLHARSLAPQIGRILEDGRTSRNLRIAAFLALGRMGDPASVSLLSGRLADPDPVWRACAAQALGETGDPSAAGQVRELSADPEPQVRMQAAIALGRLGAKEEIARIAALLADPAPAVKGAAIRALTDLEAKEHLPAIVRALDVPDPSVQIPVIDALARFRDPSTLPALLRVARDYGHGFLKTKAMETLGEIGDPAAIPTLTRILDTEPGPDYWPDSRASAMQAISRIATAKALPVADRMLSDTDARVRKHAAETLVRAGDPKAAEKIARLQEDADEGVRETAARLARVLKEARER